MDKLAWTVAVAMLTTAFAASADPGASGVGAGSPAGAIYEWVDDSGLKHASDTVPEKYKSVARRVDPSRFQISSGEQEAAERQAATLKAKAASAVPSPRPRAAQAASLSGSRPAADTPECAAWRRQVAASRECFVGFVKPDGSRGYRSCSNEPDPKPACGPTDSP